jgi:hypothetical protein
VLLYDDNPYPSPCFTMICAGYNTNLSAHDIKGGGNTKNSGFQVRLRARPLHPQPTHPQPASQLPPTQVPASQLAPTHPASQLAPSHVRARTHPATLTQPPSPSHPHPAILTQPASPPASSLSAVRGASRGQRGGFPAFRAPPTATSRMVTFTRLGRNCGPTSRL